MLLALTALAFAEDVSVVVAKDFLEPGTIIAEPDVYVAVLPAEFLPDSTFRDAAEVVGRIVREPIPANTFLRQERFADPQARAGIDALVPRGLRRVRVVQQPSRWPEPWDRVDVVHVRAASACVVAQKVLVVAGEADGQIISTVHDELPYDAVHLAVKPELATHVAGLPTAETALLVRNPIDLAEAALPSCLTPPVGVVAEASTLPVKVAPNGKGTVKELLRGDNAFIAELTLQPGAGVPTHRDATEEYLIVQSGSGTMTLDGVEHAVGPGTVVYMPANAEVTYRNGDAVLKAIQVFAGPAPASKYDTWPPR